MKRFLSILLALALPSPWAFPPWRRSTGPGTPTSASWAAAARGRWASAPPTERTGRRQTARCTGTHRYEFVYTDDGVSWVSAGAAESSLGSGMYDGTQFLAGPFGSERPTWVLRRRGALDGPHAGGARYRAGHPAGPVVAERPHLHPAGRPGAVGDGRTGAGRGVDGGLYLLPGQLRHGGCAGLSGAPGHPGGGLQPVWLRDRRVPHLSGGGVEAAPGRCPARAAAGHGRGQAGDFPHLPLSGERLHDGPSAADGPGSWLYL